MKKFIKYFRDRSHRKFCQHMFRCAVWNIGSAVYRQHMGQPDLDEHIVKLKASADRWRNESQKAGAENPLGDPSTFNVR